MSDIIQTWIPKRPNWLKKVIEVVPARQNGITGATKSYRWRYPGDLMWRGEMDSDALVGYFQPAELEAA